MENYIASHLTTRQPALNPFAGFLHDARTAIDMLAELQQPQGVRGGRTGYTASG